MRTDLERAAAGLPVAAMHDTSAATQLIAPAAGYDGYATATALDQVPDEEEFEPEPRGMTWRKLTLAALAILAVAALIGYLAFRDDGGGQQARVPDIVGSTLEEAQVLIEGRGLVMGTPVEQPTTNPDEIGIVLSQDPAFNATVEPGSTVTPTVGVEPEPITVPANLVGMTQEEAEAAIVEAGLTVGDVTPDEESDEEPGTVTATDPASGEQVPPGTAVNLAVARAPEQVAVPSVIGRSLQDAQAAIEAAGLVLGNVESRESDRPQNEVLETDPAGGTEVDPGSTVNVAISAGQATVEVPDVTGQQQGAAEATLRQQGFTVIAQPEANCDENQGVVFAQNPEGGTEVNPGANVVIRVAEPPPQGCDDD
jgi:eukaryotic-like serine/threonine-protein kinase